MRNKSKKIWRNLLTGLLLVALLVTGVFAWIYGNVTPEIKGNFKIGNMAGLNFVFNNEKTNLIDLNSSFGFSTDSLNLNEVSTVDGVNFVARDTSNLYMESGTTDPKEVISFRNAEVDVVTETETGTSVYGDYLDISFHMTIDYSSADEAEYYIYFLNGTLDDQIYSTCFKASDGSSITSDGLRALRACLRINGAPDYGPLMQALPDAANPKTGEHWAFFGNKSELGDGASPYLTNAVAETQTVTLKQASDLSSGSARIAGTYTIDYMTGITQWPYTFGTVENVTVQSFASCSIDPSALEGGLRGTEAPGENYLFKLDSEHPSVDMTLRVWLEGGSNFCVNGQVIPEDEVNLDMFFVAYTVAQEEAQSNHLKKG